MVFYAAAASIVVFLLFLFPITDYDIWWHLAGGQLMFESWSFPYLDTFSYTAQGAPWLPNSWGFTAVSYLGYELFGLDGLNVAKAFVSLFVFLVIITYLFRERLLSLLSLSFVAAALFSVRAGFSMRPQTLSYLFFVLFLVSLFSFKKYKSYKYIAILAALQFLWVNFHASFIWGLAFTGILVAVQFLQTRALDKKNALLLGSVFIASLAHLFYGPAYLIRIVSEVFTPAFALPVRDLAGADSSIFFSLSGIVLLFGIGVFLIAVKRKEFDIASILLFMGVATFFSARFQREVILLVALLAPAYFPLLKDSLPVALKKFRSPSWLPRVSFFIFLLVLFLVAKNSSLGIGNGLSRFTYPVKAVEFLQEEQILEKSRGNLYHTYNFGGYLTWANQPHRVFIDGRLRPYHGEPFARYWDNFAGGDAWSKSIEQYGITTALMTHPHTLGGTVYNNSSPMFPKEDWALVYYDDTASIYVLRIPELAEFIERNEYSILDPQQLNISYLAVSIQSEEDFTVVMDEIQKALELNPESFRLHFTLSYLFSLSGNLNQTMDELETTLEINPHFTPAKDILKTLRATPS